MLQTFSIDEQLVAELKASVVSGERSRFVAHAIRRALDELYEAEARSGTEAPTGGAGAEQLGHGDVGALPT